MHLEIPDDSLTAAIRRIVREEVAAILEAKAAEIRRDRTDAAPVPAAETEPAELRGVSPYAMRRRAEFVLEQAGDGPLHVQQIADRMYLEGFKHKGAPKNPDQLLSSLNSLASPSQHPDRFRRSGPRMLELVG